ncbi:MAG: OmpA family protein [Rubrivivax sp.]|nr:OmpA family protein [Rubrivivax sp.]
MTRLTRLPATLSLVALAAVLAGCATRTPVAQAPVAAPAAEPVAVAAAPAAPEAAPAPVADSDVANVDLGNNAAADERARFVYFDFDSFIIRPEFTPAVDAHARRLAEDRAARLRIAGHTDERGSREYNLALGQRRADAVARSIALVGGDASRIEAVSYGKERPKAEGRNEEAWALNRRAELQER